MTRWAYCAVRDDQTMECAWPNCTCGRTRGHALEIDDLDNDEGMWPDYEDNPYPRNHPGH